MSNKTHKAVQVVAKTLALWDAADMDLRIDRANVIVRHLIDVKLLEGEVRGGVACEKEPA